MLELLIAEFNGAIKYAPMLKDHPDWTKEECINFARMWHAVAIAQLRERGPSMAIEGPKWNGGIPYCRNIPTEAMLKEAGYGHP